MFVLLTWARRVPASKRVRSRPANRRPARFLRELFITRLSSRPVLGSTVNRAFSLLARRSGGAKQRTLGGSQVAFSIWSGSC